MCGWLDLQPVALLEGVGMGEGGGGGGGPGRELVGSWSLGSRLLPATAGARGQPAAGCSDLIMVNFLSCGLRCLYDAVLLELWRKMELVLQSCVLKLPHGKKTKKNKNTHNRFLKE